VNPAPAHDSRAATAPGGRPVFHVRGLTKIYGEGTAQVRALAGVDLDLAAGELVVLLGPSGSGKTTLLNQLGGLDIPTAGTLRYRDTDLTEIAAHPMAPEAALEMVGLGARLDHFPAQLSGGEQQRVAIARAIAKRPEVLLCDEPTGALDVKTGIVVLEALERANRELGTLTVIITHNAVMADMADRVIRFMDCKVLSEQRNTTRAAPATLRW
jgi:putative ABC transport system ATP-binding protein